jgi:carbon-monoxide dehydrogenase medium subunit
LRFGFQASGKNENLVQYEAEKAAAEAEPQDDLNASSEYRVHLAKVLVRRALEKASA